MGIEQGVLDAVEEQQTRRVCERRRRGQRRSMLRGVERSRHREKQELKRLVERRGGPLVASRVSPDQIEADDCEEARDEIRMAAANPDRIAAEQRAPGRVVEDQLDNVRVLDMREERRRVRADDGDKSVALGLEHAPEPQRDEAQRAHQRSRHGRPQKAVSQVSAIDRDEQHDDARCRKQRCVATPRAAQPQAADDEPDTGHRRDRDLAHRREPSRIDRKPHEVARGEDDGDHSADAQNLRRKTRRLSRCHRTRRELHEPRRAGRRNQDWRRREFASWLARRRLSRRASLRARRDRTLQLPQPQLQCSQAVFNLAHGSTPVSECATVRCGDHDQRGAVAGRNELHHGLIA